MARWAPNILVVFLLLSPPAWVAAQDLVTAADKIYDQGGLDRIQASISLYLQALQADPNSYEAHWKCARAHRNYGNEAKKQAAAEWQTRCAEYGRKGMYYAQKAVDLAPDKPEGYYYYGLSVGIYADGVSILTALREGLKSKTQSSLEKAYSLDKMYDQAGPILSLARFWALLPWPLKDTQKSLKYYREYQATPFFELKAEAKVYLAELLIDLGGRQNRDEARGLLQLAAQSNDQYYAAWARRLLEAP